MSSKIDVSTASLGLSFNIQANRLELGQLSYQLESWLHSSSGLFAVYVGGKRYDANNMDFVGSSLDYTVSGVQHLSLQFVSDIEIVHHLKIYADTSLIECWQTIKNHQSKPVTVERIDSFALIVPDETYELFYYTGNWGSEFEGHKTQLDQAIYLESKTGRSSKGNHPWFALEKNSGTILSGAVAWSGNWVCRFEPLENGGLSLSGGLHDWGFEKQLDPGNSMESPAVVLVLAKNLNEISQNYAKVGRRYWYPRTQLSSLVPVEWNHWWSYEDDHINEQVFADNVAVAAEMGVDVCVLDAGWFGPSDPGSFWTDYRGDWDQVNKARFPTGLRTLSDRVHSKGMQFGLWCEIEAVGPKAEISQNHPELIAQRDGESLGYVCLANPQARAWCYATLSRLIQENQLDWIKLDFNLDPGTGCNRTDHGHGPGDGLYEHYQGYYDLLERIRKNYPQVTLESCSSGGLRIDLGLLRRTDMTFLSDPDWPVHDLQVFWGASTMLGTDSILHWSFGDWINKNPPPQQNFNPRDPHLKPHQLDYYTRISMLNVFGISQKLPDLPAWVKERLSFHARIYKNHVRVFVREANLYRLTEQPRRDGTGERWSAFQYSLADQSAHLLFVFRLPGSEGEKSVVLQDLDPERIYQLTGFEGEVLLPCSGKTLMTEGIRFKDMPVEASCLYTLR